MSSRRKGKQAEGRTPDSVTDSADPSTDAFASTPSASARKIISVFILLWLVWQVAVPLSYYVGDNVDDERFAWRMFSGIWLAHKSCTASVTEFRMDPVDGEAQFDAIDLGRTLHGTWVNQLAKKNRRLVVEKFLQNRCEADPSVTEVQYIRTCAGVSQSRIPPVTLRFDCRASHSQGTYASR